MTNASRCNFVNMGKICGCSSSGLLVLMFSPLDNLVFQTRCFEINSHKSMTTYFGVDETLKEEDNYEVFFFGKNSTVFLTTLLPTIIVSLARNTWRMTRPSTLFILPKHKC